MKTRKCNSCQNGTTVKHGWILLLEKEPLTYMGKESPLYNMEMKKPRYGRNMTLLEYLFLGIAKVFAYCRWEDI